VRRLAFLITILLLAVPAHVPRTSARQIGNGYGAGRATDEDVAHANGDVMAYYRALNDWERQRIADANEIATLRQQQLTGAISDAENAARLQEIASRELARFADNVVPAAQPLLTNPAVPCDVARDILTKTLQVVRQAQLLGWDVPAFNLFADGKQKNADGSIEPESLGHKMLMATQQRCLEESFDACMQTGNGASIVRMLTETMRQLELIGADTKATEEFEHRAVYLYRRCTVYQLKYDTDDLIDAREFGVGATSDGSIILLSDVDPYAGVAGLASPHVWKGPRASDPNDVITSVTTCHSKAGGIGLTCQDPTGAESSPGEAEIKNSDFQMKDQWSSYSVSEDGRVTTTKHVEGTDTLTASFRPTFVKIQAKTTNSIRGIPNVVPIQWPISTAFAIVHNHTCDLNEQNSVVRLLHWTHVGHPTLFELTVKDPPKKCDDDVAWSDTSPLKLVHRPDLFPADEIVAKWELGPAKK
jgi:hypothetical protein